VLEGALEKSRAEIREAKGAVTAAAGRETALQHDLAASRALAAKSAASEVEDLRRTLADMQSAHAISIQV
jgi:hypothetical protein